MIIAEWIIYFMIFCLCVFSLGLGSVMFVISINVFLDRKNLNKK